MHAAVGRGLHLASASACPQYWPAIYAQYSSGAHVLPARAPHALPVGATQHRPPSIQPEDAESITPSATPDSQSTAGSWRVPMLGTGMPPAVLHASTEYAFETPPPLPPAPVPPLPPPPMPPDPPWPTGGAHGPSSTACQVESMHRNAVPPRHTPAPLDASSQGHPCAPCLYTRSMLLYGE